MNEICEKIKQKSNKFHYVFFYKKNYQGENCILTGHGENMRLIRLKNYCLLHQELS